MNKRENNRSDVMVLAKRLAVDERERGETVDGLWTRHHTEVLASSLNCYVRDLTEDEMAWAEEAYAAECSK